MSGAPRPAAFLDRDGTLIHDPGFLGDPEQATLLDGAAEAVALLRGAGYVVVVISNQSGVARGFFDEAAVHAVNRRVAELLAAANPEARIEAFYYCPHLDTAGKAPCPCRKPRPGLLLRAARELGLDLPNSVGIGDHERDVEAARAAGCRFAQRIGGDRAPTLLSAVKALLSGPPTGRTAPASM